MYFGCTEERGRFWILGGKIVSERREHRYESIVPIRQGKDAELIEYIGSVPDRGKQPFNVVLIDTLREEGDHSQKRSGVRTKVLEQGRGEGKFDRGGEARVMLGVKHTRSVFSHSLVSRLAFHLLCWATVASNVIDRGWKSSCFRTFVTKSDRSSCL